LCKAPGVGSDMGGKRRRYFSRSYITRKKVRCRTKSPILRLGPGLHSEKRKSPGSHV
jgi:hypothetical protein